MNLETIIGLEIHVQLKTRTKMFCGCSNDGENQAPNTIVCEICLGHPGVLPVPNKQAIEWSIKSALALNCRINYLQNFDRKNYFYPDLPKGYQISQLDHPIGERGYMEIKVPRKAGSPVQKIGITRLHLEEDAAKNIHQGEKIKIDYNRGGTPLMEIVTEPDFRSPVATKAFLQELRLIMRYLGVSDADMEKGHLRCDANISLRPEGEDKLFPKTELKNLNSFKAVERGLEYEIIRQTKLWVAGTRPDEQSTRGWDENKQVTVEQRTKETSEDYRYFPEPDIPNLRLERSNNQKTTINNDNSDDIVIEQIKARLPELPTEKRKRFIEEYEIKSEVANDLVADISLANYFENSVSELKAWLESLEEGSSEDVWKKHKKRLSKLVSNWLINKLGGLVINQNLTWADIKITPENFAEFITLIHQNKLNSATAQTVLARMLKTGEDPSYIMEDGALEQVSDVGELDSIVEQVINVNPDEVGKYKAGKKVLMQFFVGQVMRETKGKANPEVVLGLLKNKLDN